MALALHLSRLHAPAPRPHHRRIARAVLDDAAARQEGQFFPLPNGDMVLLWRAVDAGAALATTLARLFQVDVGDPTVLLTRWSFPAEASPFLSYVEFTEQEAAARPASGTLTEPVASMSALEAISGLVEKGSITDLLHRQTAVLLPSGAGRVEPLYREITFSVAVLEARVEAAGHVTADPFLFRHLASRLDSRMLQTLSDDLRGDGKLTAWAREVGPRLHINLTPSAILSPAFAVFADACQASRARVAVEVALVDVCADPETFLLARERLDAAGLGFVLDAVSHHGLLITSPSVLRPELVKLEWSRQIPQAGDALAAALARIDVSRIVLQRADTEEALRWGLRQGIRRFQGRHADAVLAAGRIEVCEHSGLCSLRQCMERGFATSSAGRVGCRNLPLLDAGAPAPQVAGS